MPLLLLLLGFAVLIIGGMLWNEVRNRAEMEAEQAERHDEPRNAIRKSFREYCEARLGGDWSKVVTRVDTATLRHFEKLRDLALRGSPVEVRALSPSQKLHVLMFRARLADSLEDRRGGSLFGFVLKNELIDSDRLRGAMLGEITIDGDRATSPRVVHGRPAASPWSFHREADIWRLHYEALVGQDDLDVRAAARHDGITEDQWIVARVAAATGAPVEEDIWEPLREY